MDACQIQNIKTEIILIWKTNFWHVITTFQAAVFCLPMPGMGESQMMPTEKHITR